LLATIKGGVYSAEVWKKLMLSNSSKKAELFSMSERSEMEEAIETQASVGTEPVTEQAMLGESPLRTIPNLLGVNQQATVQLPYEFNPLRSEDVESVTIDGYGGAGG
jgi:hypothetical protein